MRQQRLADSSHRAAASSTRGGPGHSPGMPIAGAPIAGAPPTAAEIQVALLGAYRALAPGEPPVGIDVERVRILPPRAGRAGWDVPVGQGSAMVHPARVRYAVGRAVTRGDPSAHDRVPGPVVVVEATYRFRRQRGAWTFTGPLAAAVVGDHPY